MTSLLLWTWAPTLHISTPAWERGKNWDCFSPEESDWNHHLYEWRKSGKGKFFSLPVSPPPPPPPGLEKRAVERISYSGGGGGFPINLALSPTPFSSYSPPLPLGVQKARPNAELGNTHAEICYSTRPDVAAAASG